MSSSRRKASSARSYDVVDMSLRCRKVVGRPPPPCRTMSWTRSHDVVKSYERAVLHVVRCRRHVVTTSSHRRMAPAPMSYDVVRCGFTSCTMLSGGSRHDVTMSYDVVSHRARCCRDPPPSRTRCRTTSYTMSSSRCTPLLRSFTIILGYSFGFHELFLRYSFGIA